MTETLPKIIIAAFEDPEDAQKALRSLGRADRADQIELQQGALVSRDLYGGVHIRDFRQMGLGEVLRSTANITLDVGISGAGLLLGTAVGGLRILARGAWRVAGVATTGLASPVRGVRTAVLPDRRVKAVAADLEPGATAIVAFADPDVAPDLAAELVRRGGVLVLQEPAE